MKELWDLKAVVYKAMRSGDVCDLHPLTKTENGTVEGCAGCFDKSLLVLACEVIEAVKTAIKTDLPVAWVAFYSKLDDYDATKKKKNKA